MLAAEQLRRLFATADTLSLAAEQAAEHVGEVGDHLRQAELNLKEATRSCLKAQAHALGAWQAFGNAILGSGMLSTPQQPITATGHAEGVSG